MRGQGRVFRPMIGGRESKVWWLDYGVNGVRHRESSKTTNKRAALEVLRQRIGKRKEGMLTGRPDKVTLADLKDGLKMHYTREANASWTRAVQAFAHLEAFFGTTAKVLTITKARVNAYQDKRLAAGAARNSVRYEIAILSAAFGVAVDQDLLAAKPVFKLTAQGDKRTGFFEEGDLAVLVTHLPAAIGDLVRFLRMTGWRRGEAVGLLWSQVDWNDDDFPGRHDEPVPGTEACVRIGEAETKGRDSRTFPIADAPELRTLLLDRWKVRDGLHVFHKHGKPIGDFRKAWARACKAAGLTGRLVHDLRRTAARDFRRAGVSEGEIMKLCGWKTRAMFDRYNIIDAADLTRAVQRRFAQNGVDSTEKGKQTANISAELEAGK